MKVYIVTSGTYSDYEIEAVFSTEDKAKAYVDKYGDYDNLGYKEWELDTEDLNKEKAVYEVRFSSGESTCARLLNWSSRPDTIRTFLAFGNTLGYVLTVETDSAERAKKIASERLMQVKAMPYLFPRLTENCVGYNYPYHVDWFYPTYDYHTKEIILKDGEFLKE